MIRFCEFCSAVYPAEDTHCTNCGARLLQSVAEAEFNDPANPWPFQPVDRLCLRIQGQPRYLCFSGTHSVYHFWTALHRGFAGGQLCWRIGKGEMELALFPGGDCPEGYWRLRPDRLLNCWHRKFSFYTYQEPDPALELAPGSLDMTYQGTVEINDCPARAWGNVLGWLVGTAPRPAPDDDWTYDI